VDIGGLTWGRAPWGPGAPESAAWWGRLLRSLEDPRDPGAGAEGAGAPLKGLKVPPLPGDGPPHPWRKRGKGLGGDSSFITIRVRLLQSSVPILGPSIRTLKLLMQLPNPFLLSPGGGLNLEREPRGNLSLEPTDPRVKADQLNGHYFSHRLVLVYSSRRFRTPFHHPTDSTDGRAPPQPVLLYPLTRGQKTNPNHLKHRETLPRVQ